MTCRSTCWCSPVPSWARPGPGSAPGATAPTLTLDPLDPASMDRLVDALVPGMPPAARSAVTAHAQGIPLFAVETVRALIDRDIVQPVEGVYRLVGDVGELAVPDSLHALLAARLDALDPGVRRLVADAAVLGTTFPAEALIAVSGQDEPAVRAGLAELLRREVLSVSADPLSPERGSYQFAQQMLRQVAYDTLSRRDRKARHLAVAAHLRAAFPGDGEEVADVIARHYLDALHAVPDDPDTGRDPRAGHQRADPGRRARRAHRRPRPRRHQLRHRRRADRRPDTAGRAASAPPDAVGTRRAGRRRQRRLGRGDRARRPCPRSLPAARRGPGGRPRPGHRRAGAAPVGPPRRGARAAHRRRGGPAGRSGHRHGARPGAARDAGGVRRLARRRQAHHRGAHPRPGPRRRHRPARRPVHHPRDLPQHDRAAPRSGRLLPRSRAARRRRPATTCSWDARCSTCRTRWRSPIPRPAAEAARTAAGHLRQAGDRDTWPLRSRTWSRRC